mmetsp:Transcript_9690/g.18173  ORF Transcript_9690/g.18173 Transcript_9690/m.18173 type:complete len:679 (+) Transcript_9690:75-2111(+)
MNNCEGETLWHELFPHRVQVSWEAFAVAFETYFVGKYPKSFVPTDISVRNLLFYAIVQENSIVTKIAFLNFLQLFGPIRLCLVKVSANIFATPAQPGGQRVLFPWYHGPITRKQAEQLLLTKTPTMGDFLVRLSESQGGKFTIVYVSSSKSLKNVLIHNYFEAGYGLELSREQCSEGHNFEKLPDFIAMHHHKLHSGIPSQLYLQCKQDQQAKPSPPSRSPNSTTFNLTSSSLGSASNSVNSPASQEINGVSTSIHSPVPPPAPGPQTQFLSQELPEECPYGAFSMPLPVTSPRNQMPAPLQSSAVLSSGFFNDAEGDDNYGCFVAPQSLGLSSSQSLGLSSSAGRSSLSPNVDNTGPPSLSRRQLSSNLDISKHLLKENKCDQALEVTVSVIETIEKKTNCSPSGVDGVDNDDLLLIARGYFQKGNIEESFLKGTGGEGRQGLEAFSQSRAYLTELFRRSETSDHLVFDNFTLFSNVNRKMADAFARLGDREKAEFHYAECSGIMLQDPDLDNELRNTELVNHIQRSLGSLTTSANEATATALLDSGIQAYKKGATFYNTACDFLQKALVCSRLCGAEAIELRAVANLATAESALDMNTLAIHHYHQCCILCRLIKHDNDTTLKQILFKKALLLMKAGLYHRTIQCLNESIGLATSMSNIEKLESLKQKAIDKLSQL